MHIIIILSNLWQVRFTSRCPLKIEKKTKIAKCSVVISAWTAFAYICHFPSWIWRESVVPLFFVCGLSLTPDVSCWFLKKPEQGGHSVRTPDTHSPGGQEWATSVCFKKKWQTLYKVVCDEGRLGRVNINSDYKHNTCMCAKQMQKLAKRKGFNFDFFLILLPFWSQLS